LHDDDDLVSVVVEWMVFGRFAGDWPKESNVVAKIVGALPLSTEKWTTLECLESSYQY
jgi:hypothetical protein